MIVYIQRRRNVLAWLAIVVLLSMGAQVRLFIPDCKKLTIVMYHSISGNSGTYELPPKQLDSDLAYLKELGYETVTIGDLVNYTENKGELPEKPVMLTFDDGYYNNFLYVLPLLEKYDMRAVLSVIGSAADEANTGPEYDAKYAMLNWEELYILNASGRFELQNHSYNMHTLDKGRVGCKKRPGESEEHYTVALTKDTDENFNKALQLLGVKMTCYTYPFGAIGRYSEDIIKSLGYKATLSCMQGVNLISRAPGCLYHLKRYNRPSGECSEVYFRRIGVK